MSNPVVSIAPWFGPRAAAVATMLWAAVLPAASAGAAANAESASPASSKASADNSDSSKPEASEQSGASKQPSQSVSSSMSKEVTTTIPEGPPPKPPRPEDQELRPYVAPVQPLVKERHVVLSAVAGPWWLGLNGTGAATRPGPVWGVSGRVEPSRWMGVRVLILRGNQPVTPDYGALGVPNAQISQPDFQIIYWAIRMEPTWHVSRTLSLWAGVGLGWARAIAPEPKIGDLNWITADRTCVYVEGHWALGAEYELIHDWVNLSLDLSAASLGYQHGSAHDPIQAFTPDGHRTHVGGYPDFGHKVQALFGVGVIL